MPLLLLALTPLALAAPAEPAPAEPAPAEPAPAEPAPAADPHRVGLGVRTGLWYGGAGAPMLGGQITLRPSRHLRILGFSDHAAKGLDDVLQVDHVIGFHAILPVVRWRGGTVGPSVGSCVDFRTWRQGKDLSLVRADVLFGPRAGVHLEQDLDARWSLQATATAALYVGNTEATYGWGGRTDGLEASGVVQAQVGVNRWW